MATGLLRRLRNPSLMAATALVLTTACSLPLSARHSFNGIPFETPREAPSFALINQDGAPVNLTDYRGKVVLLYFGFTHCRTYCPATLATWRSVRAQLGPQAEQVGLLFVTVDPWRDTPERLKEYLGQYDPTFIGLTGSEEEIEDVTSSYQAYFKHVHEDQGPQDDAGAVLIKHTTLTHVIDQSGRLVLAFRPGAPPEEVVADLQYLLRQ